MANRGIVIAIDGPSASGKGTISRLVAKQLGYEYLDTGLLYRAIANMAIKHEIAPEHTDRILSLVQKIDLDKLTPSILCTEEIGAVACQIAGISELREALYGVQRGFALNKKGVVIDGRDIGTVIFPDAEYKFYITASPEVRAMRRFKQLQNLGRYATYDRVLQDIKARDTRDMSRNIAPLQIAQGAIVIDTSHLEINDTVLAVLSSIKPEPA